MPFPISPRVIYRQNPLVEVICQIRFPPILRIDTEPPARLQESIRGEYPHYSEASNATIQLPDGTPPEVARMVQGFGVSRQAGMRHEFVSKDQAWQVTLSRDALALKTTAYQRWEDFRARTETVVRALIAEYKPSFSTRVGLRYVDLVQRSTLGLGEEPWSNLLSPAIAGEFAAPTIAAKIESAAREVVIRLDDAGSRVRIRHGLALVEPSNEPSFLIDSDYFTDTQTEIANVLTVLDGFNRVAGHLFRWCIQDRLHTALGPQPAE